MFLESFKVTSVAVFQIFILGAIGYYLVKKSVISQEGLSGLTRLLVQVTLPVLMFCELTRNFTFSLYPNWWIFPIISLFITALGLGLGILSQRLIKDHQNKAQFLSLVTFQNSGYLPLILVATILPRYQVGSMFIYIFLFLLGFNLAIWSLGVHMLTSTKAKRPELANLFNPPVIATLFSLLFIALQLNRFTPDAIMTPLRMVGDCTLPLAMFVVGGNLASIKLGELDKKALILISVLKLLVLPLLGLLFVLVFRIEKLLGLLIVMQLAMPPATTLSVIMRHYNKKDALISQGIFFGHILSLVTIPVFLSLYFALVMVK
jgi:predicted permease